MKSKRENERKRRYKYNYGTNGSLTEMPIDVRTTLDFGIINMCASID
jgi:hypothetical protein